jgi:hypothetical protein
MLEDESASKRRAKNRAIEAEHEGRAIVGDIRQKVDVWLDRLARIQALRDLGRPSPPLDRLLLDMLNARRQLQTELQMQSRAVRESPSVTNLRRSLERAIAIVRMAAGEAPGQQSRSSDVAEERRHPRQTEPNTRSK